jgi:hypothetical protein
MSPKFDAYGQIMYVWYISTICFFITPANVHWSKNTNQKANKKKVYYFLFCTECTWKKKDSSKLNYTEQKQKYWRQFLSDSTKIAYL